MSATTLSDVLFEECLSSAVETMLAGTFDDFYEIFRSCVKEDTVLEVWNKLQEWGEDGVRVQAAFAPTVYKGMVCLISVVCEETQTHAPFDYGGDVRRLEGAPGDFYNGVEFSAPIEDTIGIYIMAPHRMALRVLDLFVKSALLSNQEVFWGDGGARPVWLRSSDMAPVEVKTNESVLKYVRKQTWSMSTYLALRPYGGRRRVELPILVHADGTFVDAVPDATTRTYEQLTGKTPGGVKVE